MISKEQYQQLKQLCRSSNSNDVIMVGPVILGLRNNKQLKRRQVNDLFSLTVRDKRFCLRVPKFDINQAPGAKDYVEKYGPFVWNTKTKQYWSSSYYKLAWLNGQL